LELSTGSGEGERRDNHEKAERKIKIALKLVLRNDD
jgi:hypothetical protein